MALSLKSRIPLLKDPLSKKDYPVENF